MCATVHVIFHVIYHVCQVSRNPIGLQAALNVREPKQEYRAIREVFRCINVLGVLEQ